MKKKAWAKFVEQRFRRENEAKDVLENDGASSTVDLRSAADIIQREANTGGSDDQLRWSRHHVEDQQLAARFQKDPLQDKAFTQKKESEAEKKHSSRSLLNVDNYNEAMESARMSFTNALKNTRNVDYEAELAALSIQSVLQSRKHHVQTRRFIDLTDTGPPINKEEMTPWACRACT